MNFILLLLKLWGAENPKRNNIFTKLRGTKPTETLREEIFRQFKNDNETYVKRNLKKLYNYNKYKVLKKAMSSVTKEVHINNVMELISFEETKLNLRELNYKGLTEELRHGINSIKIKNLYSLLRGRHLLWRKKVPLKNQIEDYVLMREKNKLQYKKKKNFSIFNIKTKLKSFSI